MKVKVLVSMAGKGFALEPGDPYDCGEAEAKRLMDAGYAVPWAEKKVERAVRRVPAEKR